METLKKKKRSSRGRQKIDIKKIEKEAARQVAFTKRRQGVMKKASELSILCGVEFAIVAFSPAGKPFSLGHPSVESIVARFLDHKSVGSVQAQQQAEWQLNLHCAEMEQRVEEARERKAVAEDRLKAATVGVGELMRRALMEMEEMEGMSLEELEAAIIVMDDVRMRVELRQHDLLFAVAVRPISTALNTVGLDEVKQLEEGMMVSHPFNNIGGSF